MPDTDTLEQLWELPVVDEPDLGIIDVTDTFEETDDEDICDGTAQNDDCPRPAIVRVFWQPCACPDDVGESIHCMECYESYPFQEVLGRYVRIGDCSVCLMSCMMIRTGRV
jgi:hypothetical protein